MTDAPTQPATPDASPDAAPAHATERDVFGRTPVGYPDWSHRRAEPRVFALVWMLFLMGVTVLMFTSFSDALSVSHAITRPAARRMIAATMLGVVCLWPAFRLSQGPAPNPTAAALRDLFVVLVPAQAIVWPQAMRVLAGWPLPMLVVIAAWMGAWAFVVAGVVACADAPLGRRLPRAAWMLVPVLLVAAVPAWAMLTRTVGVVRADVPRVGWLLSPVVGVLELTRDRDALGLHPIVHPVAWRVVVALVCLGGALLLLARASEVAWRGRRA